MRLGARGAGAPAASRAASSARGFRTVASTRRAPPAVAEALRGARGGADKHDAAWAVPEAGGPAVYAIASPATFRHKASRRCLFCVTGGTHGCGELLSVPQRARSALE